MSRFLPSLPLAPIAALCLALAAPAALAADVEAQEDSISFARLAPANQDAVVEAVAAAVVSVDEATAAANSTDWGRARREAAKARTFVRLARHQSPAARLADAIDGVRKGLKKDKKVSADALTPIYAELDDYSELVATADVRTAVEKAKGHASKGHLEETDVALGEAWDSITYVEVDVPLARAYDELTQTLQSITPKVDQPGVKQHLASAATHLQPVVKVAQVDVTTESFGESVELYRRK